MPMCCSSEPALQRDLSVPAFSNIATRPGYRTTIRPTKLSRPLSEIRPQYDVVVIGSGYGGGIAASRFSRAGAKVCVLERGREILTGDFPKTEMDLVKEVQVKLSQSTACGVDGIRNPTALYDLHMHSDQHVLVGCGLGGTSLINANVAVEVDFDLLVKGNPLWPKEYRDGDFNEVFAPYYARARKSLRTQALPDAFSRLTKAERMRQVVPAYEEHEHGKGNKGRVDFFYPPLAVTWAAPVDPGRLATAPLEELDEAFVTPEGIEQRGCTLCGDCCSGCNVGAKNTTQMTYLPDAYQFGAEIFCEAQVSRLERKPEGGWRVHFNGGYAASGAPGPERTVDAKTVVLGAGSLGSTEILARSREHGLDVSDKVGARWSGNGGLVGCSYNNDKPMNSFGLGARGNPSGFVASDWDPRSLPKVAPPPGPCIVSMTKYYDDKQVLKNWAIEDGSSPGSGTNMLKLIFLALSKCKGSLDYSQHGLIKDWHSFKRIFNDEVLGAYSNDAAMRFSACVLGVCHDDVGGDGHRGTLKFDKTLDRIVVDFPGAANTPTVKMLYEKMGLFAKVHKGTFVANPMYLWHPPMPPLTETTKDIISVHPLGGCQMGDDAEHGVVSHEGCVFTGRGAETYPDLLVLDGSAIPESLAVNPYLTICAFAERAVERFVNRKVRAGCPGWRPLGFEPHPSVRSGPVHCVRDIEDLSTAAAASVAAATAATAAAPSVERGGSSGAASAAAAPGSLPALLGAKGPTEERAGRGKRSL